MGRPLFPGRRVMWMEPDGIPPSFAKAGEAHCCIEMNDALINACAEHAGDPFGCGDMLIAYSDVFDEYGLIIHDGGASYLTISWCPFCGAELPASRRDEWFDRIEAIGSGPFSDNLPEAFRSGAWRRAAGT